VNEREWAAEFILAEEIIKSVKVLFPQGIQ
jgi:hypothetical protein